MKKFTFFPRPKNVFLTTIWTKKIALVLFLVINIGVSAQLPQTVWTGALSTNWFDPGNWTQGVPTLGYDAIIPPTSNNPIIGDFQANNDFAKTNNLTIQPGAKVTVAPRGVLGVWGILANNAGVNGLLIESDPNGTLPMGTLAFQNDVSINPVPATVQFYSKSFTDITDPLNPDYKWQYFGIPFTNYVPGTSLGKYKPFRWDETYTDNLNWKVVEPDDTMLPVKGYAITQDEPGSYFISGYLNKNWFNNPIDTVLSLTTGNGNDYPGNHILSNPFMYSLNISYDIIFENMEASIGFYNTGSFNDWVGNFGSSGNNPGQYLNVPQEMAGYAGLPSLIPSLQGFLVKATQQNSKITFNPSSGFFNQEPLRTKSNSSGKIYSIIDIVGATNADKVWLFTESNCTKGFDNGWDSRKIMGSNSAPQLYFVENDNKFQVNSVDDINGSFIGFRKGVDNEYTMTFTHHNAELAYPNGIYLMDLVANKTVNVTENGSTYTFTVNGGSFAKAAKAPAAPEVVRFKIVTSPGLTTDINNTKNEIKVFISEKSIIFDNQTEKQAQMTLFDVTGKVVMRSSVNAGVSTVNVNVPAGTYLVQVIADRTNIKSSIIIK